MSILIHDPIFQSAARTPDAEALVDGAQRCSYAALAAQIDAACALFLAQGLRPGERIAVYMEKRIENVVALFGAASAAACSCRLIPCSSRRRWRTSWPTATCACW